MYIRFKNNKAHEAQSKMDNIRSRMRNGVNCVLNLLGQQSLDDSRHVE